MELNREQIIKALEWCSSGGKCMQCTESDKNPNLSVEGCMALQMRDALSLIKELTEENEAWQKRLITEKEKADKAYYDLACEVEDLRAENERLKQDKKILELQIEAKERICESYMLQYGTVADKEVFLKKERADTVRKMKEQIHEKAYTNNYCQEVVLLSDIDQIAKEMEEAGYE